VFTLPFNNPLTSQHSLLLHFSFLSSQSSRPSITHSTCMHPFNLFSTLSPLIHSLLLCPLHIFSPNLSPTSHSTFSLLLSFSPHSFHHFTLISLLLSSPPHSFTHSTCSNSVRCGTSTSSPSTQKTQSGGAALESVVCNCLCSKTSAFSPSTQKTQSGGAAI